MSVKLTHLDKVYWKKEGISKGEMIEHYRNISRFILPYLKNRPVVLKRFPDGVARDSFFEKNAGRNAPSFAATVDVSHTDRTVSYLVINNSKTLLYAANLGSIELHPFHSSIKSLDRPDYMVFDLDPEKVPFRAVVDTAQALHEVLDEIGLPNLCKTSGARGLHIYVPLGAKYGYDEVKRFADAVASVVNKRLPAITSLERLPKNRQKKVYIDTLQNHKGQTLVCPYSLRAKPNAPVSTPLDWKEVKAGLDPEDFTMKTIRARLAKKGDLFKKILGKGADLKAALIKLGRLRK